MSHHAEFIDEVGPSRIIPWCSSIGSRAVPIGWAMWAGAQRSGHAFVEGVLRVIIAAQMHCLLASVCTWGQHSTHRLCTGGGQKPEGNQQQSFSASPLQAHSLTPFLTSCHWTGHPFTCSTFSPSSMHGICLSLARVCQPNVHFPLQVGLF